MYYAIVELGTHTQGVCEISRVRVWCGHVARARARPGAIKRECLDPWPGGGEVDTLHSSTHAREVGPRRPRTTAHRHIAREEERSLAAREEVQVDPIFPTSLSSVYRWWGSSEEAISGRFTNLPTRPYSIWVVGKFRGGHQRMC